MPISGMNKPKTAEEMTAEIMGKPVGERTLAEHVYLLEVTVKDLQTRIAKLENPIPIPRIRPVRRIQ